MQEPRNASKSTSHETNVDENPQYNTEFRLGYLLGPSDWVAPQWGK